MGKLWIVVVNWLIVFDMIEIFGVECCMFVSNFLVDSLCGLFVMIFNGFCEIVGENMVLFYDNVICIYGMN